MIPPGKPIKLVVWDSNEVLGRAALVASLDERGCLQSLLDSDDPERAQARLKRSGMADFFLCPQLGVQDKPAGLLRIAGELNIALDTILVVDDEPHARQDMLEAHPAVRTLASEKIADDIAMDPLAGPSLPGMEPRPRRLVYAEEQARRQSEREFAGPREAFLASLNMTITVRRASLTDLRRVKELVTRTNQLGVTYSEAELTTLLSSPDRECWLVSLEDRFGDCGQVGFVQLAISAPCWTLELFLFSCRVLPRGVDTIVLNALLLRARAAHVRLRAQFRLTRRNESLWSAYQEAGFVPLTSDADRHVLEHPLVSIPEHPSPVRLRGAWTDGD